MTFPRWKTLDRPAISRVTLAVLQGEEFEAPHYGFGIAPEGEHCGSCG